MITGWASFLGLFSCHPLIYLVYSPKQMLVSIRPAGRPDRDGALNNKGGPEMPDYTFLVVDDSPTMRQLISFSLKRIPGSKIVEANDGVDALKKLGAQEFSLVLTDINMPIMDGLKLVSMMRNDPKYKDLPIIIITTEGAEDDRKAGLALGANAYVSKPVKTGELLQTVNLLLKPA
jgi:two-component system chemotaxis response regulator CheY